MKLRQEHIESIRNFFRNKPVLKAYLFGSFARKETDDNSDIDILVQLDYSKKTGLKFFKMQLDPQELLQHKVDLLSEKALLNYICPLIENDK